ncbi:MAG: DUF115 domain-containing protein [bacterium]|nr:DUF115 domain-containing protein [bacterium]
MLEKNLEYINNSALKRRLEKISLDESKVGISYCVTPSNDYILLKDEIPLDDINDPRKAIQAHLKSNIKKDMNNNDSIVIFGIGMGYLLDEVFNTYSSKIYLYEPDLMLLHFVLSNVDLSEHLSSGRIFISNDLDELVSKIENSYLSQDKVEIVYLQNYAIIKNKEILLLTQKVYDACKSKLIDVNTIAKYSKVWLNNTLENIAKVNDGELYLASDLENKFLGQTALIIGAGPSLSENIEKIKAQRNKFVIFAVNKIVKYLVQNGIIPDFAVCLDAQYISETLDIDEVTLSKINCIADIRSDYQTYNKKFNKIFVTFSNSDPLIKKMMSDNSSIPLYETGGSSATLAMVLAIKFGFAKVLMTGIDLAFKDNITYATGETMERISQDELLVDNEKKSLVKVKSVTGREVYTRSDYETFIKHFEILIKELKYENVYNLSSFGAEIAGTKHSAFENIELIIPANIHAVNIVDSFKFNMKDFVKEEFYNINNIIEVLSKGVFSPALVSSIVKSAFIYQSMQGDVLAVLKKNFDTQYADEFIEKTKLAIKNVVEILQRNKLI